MKSFSISALALSCLVLAGCGVNSSQSAALCGQAFRTAGAQALPCGPSPAVQKPVALSPASIPARLFPNPQPGMKWSYGWKRGITSGSPAPKNRDAYVIHTTLEISRVQNGIVQAYVRTKGSVTSTISEPLASFWAKALQDMVLPPWESNPLYPLRSYCPSNNAICEDVVSVPAGQFSAVPVLASNVEGEPSWTPELPLQKSGDRMIRYDIDARVGLVKTTVREALKTSSCNPVTGECPPAELIEDSYTIELVDFSGGTPKQSEKLSHARK